VTTGIPMMGRGLLAAALILSACGGAPAAAPSPSPSASPTTVANASATPTVEPGLWRIEGWVVNQAGKPVKDVCVWVGPNGCRQVSPHTDDRGHWQLDVAVGRATFDFTFEIKGYKTAKWSITPTGPMTYNLVLDNE